MINKQTGSALWESLPVMGLIIVFVSGALLAAYLLFARAWVLFHAEQALYCAAERKPAHHCRARLKDKVSSALPWGTLQISALAGEPAGARLHAQWTFKKFHVPIRRKLDLSSSKRSRSFL